MSNVNEQLKPAEERVEAEMHCSKCSRLIFSERVVSGEAIPKPFRIVQGSFIQAIDAEGIPFGAVWGFCSSCVANGENKLPLEYL